MLINKCQVNPLTKATTSNLQQFTVLTSATAGATALTISPAPITGGEYQNISTTVASKTATLVGATGASGQESLVFHKKAIAIARLAKYGEMVNDHQTELVKKLAEGGYLLDGTYSIKEAWKEVSTFTPRKNDFHCEIDSRIEQLLSDWGILKKGQ